MKIGSKVLVTTQNWFIAPDGRQYRAVYGTLKAIHTSEATLGFTPSRTHTNWYLEIGNMTIAGCQVLYSVETDECKLGDVTDFNMEKTIESRDGTSVELYLRPSVIYMSDPK